MTVPLFSAVVVVFDILNICDLVRHYHDSYRFSEIVVFIFKDKYIAFETIKFTLFLNFRINTIFQWYMYMYIILKEI